MSNQFETQEDFFNAVGGDYLHPKNCGDSMYPITVEEMYQHFKARLIEEVEVTGAHLPYPATLRNSRKED